MSQAQYSGDYDALEKVIKELLTCAKDSFCQFYTSQKM